MRTFMIMAFLSGLGWRCIEACGAPIPASFALDASRSVLNVEVVARSGLITLRDNGP